MTRIILTAMLAFASLLLVASAEAAPSATLAGEHLTANGPGIATACPTAATTISGTASGPFPGTFTETFSFTFSHEIGFGAFEPPGSLTASFEIVSGSTAVTGTKTATDVSGICDVGATQTPSTIFSGNAQGPYEATIATPEGVVSDHGTALTDLNDLFTSCALRLELSGPHEPHGLALGLELREVPPALLLHWSLVVGGRRKDFIEDEGDCVWSATRNSGAPTARSFFVSCALRDRRTADAVRPNPRASDQLGNPGCSGRP
jgi:hypothetical protein